MSHTGMKAGTAGGTLLVFLTSLGQDLLHTALMSAVGATISFCISWLLRSLMKRLQRKKPQ